MQNYIYILAKINREFYFVSDAESGQQILDFMDGEELVVDAELQDPEDAQVRIIMGWLFCFLGQPHPF